MAEKKDEREEAAAAAAGAEAAATPEPEPDDDGTPQEPAAAADPDAGEPEETAAPAPEPSPEEELRRERDELQDRLLRAMAEMDNLRKRTRREVLDSRRFAQIDLLRPLLEVQDNFDRALRAAGENEDETSLSAFREGVELIAQSFRQVLGDCGVRRIEAEGAEFDPALHEAVGQQPAPDEETASGTVLHVVQEGYLLDETVIRPSRVIVAQ
jgi:molecular chaperone GrpE